MKCRTLAVGPLETNCYLVSDEQSAECAVIDPGFEAARILDHVRQQALQVRYILLTHGHFDHIQAVSAIKEATGAQVVIHNLDAPCLTDASHSLSPKKSVVQVPPDILAEDGTRLSMGGLCFVWLHTPGHTVGSCVISCEGKNALFTGDTLFKDDCGRCDLPGGDETAMLSSLRRLALLAGDYDIYPGHGPASALSYERAHNPYVREALSPAAKP